MNKNTKTYMKKILTVMLAAAAVLTACNKEPQQNSGAAQGGVQLTVKSSDELNVKSASDVDIDSFIITFTSVSNPSYQISGVVGEFNEGQDGIVYLDPGQYIVTVTSPEDEDAAWEQPIYGGSKEFTIKSEVITEVEVVCSIQNMKVLVRTTDEFKTEFYDYNIVVTGEYDGEDASLTWTEEEIAAEKAGYFKVSDLTVDIKAVRGSGGTVTAEMTITGCEAADYHVITIGATNTGSAGVSISIDDSTNERDEEVTVPGFEDPQLGDGEDDGEDDGGATEPDDPDDDNSGTTEPDDPDDTDTTPTVTWSTNPTFDPMYLAEEMSVDLVVTAPEGIATFLVDIDSDILSTMLGLMNISLPMDLINDKDAMDLLYELEVPVGDDLLGKTEVDFNISGLVPMIYTLKPAALSEHVFTISVTDSKDQKLEQKITFIMPEE